MIDGRQFLTLRMTLDDLPARVERFLDDSASDFFTTGLWYRLLLDVDTKARLRLYTLEDPLGDPQAAIVLRSPAEREGSRLSRRWLKARSLGALNNSLSPIFEPHIRPSLEDSQHALMRFAEAISTERPAWSPIILGLFRGRSAKFEAVIQALRAAGLVVRPYLYAKNCYQETTNLSFAEFMSGRTRSIRQGVPRKRRKLSKSHRLRFELITQTDQLDRALADYHKVFAHSWKPPEDYPLFIDELCRRCAKNGSLRLLVLYLDDQAAAARITIIHKGVAHFIRTAYDERYRHFSLGQLLYEDMIRQVLEVDGVERIDFGIGDQPHKRMWLDHSDELWALAAFNTHSARGALALGRHLMSEANFTLSRLAKPLLKPPLVKIKRVFGYNPQSGRPQ